MAGKGPLCVALAVTREAIEKGMPLNPEDLLTPGGGQVKVLGLAPVQSILKEYGITRVLAKEGGRTSRGSIRNMRLYVAFLNKRHDQYGHSLDLVGVEEWWVDQVLKFFAAMPFVLHYDSAKSSRSLIRDLLEQAERRQKESAGATVVGTVLQHLVGAKLSLLMGETVMHHGASVADEQSGRDADFSIEDVAVHVTTSPTEGLIRKCRANIENNLRPLIVTTNKELAIGLSRNEKIEDRIDVFEAEQFLASNLYELGKFASKGRHTTARQLVEEYNKIVSKHETDPSLIIKVGK
ncbi:MAG: DUF4928 family protein [Deltaproteobacteria bacterium]|nr:DUF4928 family protein [Deltaproteobacteria bacterium]